MDGVQKSEFVNCYSIAQEECDCLLKDCNTLAIEVYWMPNSTFNKSRKVSMEYSQRVWYASMERLPLQTPDSVHILGLACALVFETIFRKLAELSWLSTTNIPRYFLDFAYNSFLHFIRFISFTCTYFVWLFFFVHIFLLHKVHVVETWRTRTVIFHLCDTKTENIPIIRTAPGRLLLVKGNMLNWHWTTLRSKIIHSASMTS